MNEVFRVELFGEKTDRWCDLELPASYYGLQDALDKLQMSLGDKPRWEFLEHHGFQFLHALQVLSAGQMQCNHLENPPIRISDPACFCSARGLIISSDRLCVPL